MKEYQKLSSKNKMAYDKEKRYETLNEVKLIKHIHKESKRFKCEKKSLFHDHAYEQRNPSDFKRFARDI